MRKAPIQKKRPPNEPAARSQATGASPTRQQMHSGYGHAASSALHSSASRIAQNYLARSINNPQSRATSQKSASILNAQLKNSYHALNKTDETTQFLTTGIDKATIDSDIEKDEELESGSVSEWSETGMEVYNTQDETVGEITGSDSDLSSDNMEWKDGGKKRTEKEQEQWLKEKGYSQSDVDKMKADDSLKDAVTSSAGLAISFLKVPSMWKKFKAADNNYDKFEQALEGLSTTSDTVTTGSKIGDAASGGKDSTAQDTSAISEYTSGIIGLVKSGFQSCMKLKTAYEEYQLIKANSEGEETKLDGAGIAFQEALTNTSGILQNINQFQKSFGTAQNLAIKAAVPAIGIVLSTISLMGRIVTLVQQGKLDFGSTGTESQTESILSQVKGDDKQKEKVKAILESDDFRTLIVAVAGYRQQQRDNKGIFDEYVKAQGTTPEAIKLQARLKKRYPSNYDRIDEVYKRSKKGYVEANIEVKKLSALGVTQVMLDAIIDDQTLINHLEEIKGKRERNAKIGIFTDLVNIGADIAVLTGTGAAVGAGMKAGTAAIDVARKGGNAIKFGARSKGSEDFSSGAEKGLFGKSLYDSTDILKNDKAKKERYFNSARLLVENIGDHEKKVADAGKTPSAEEKKKLATSYSWVESKLLGSGASVTLVKAMANSDSKSGNDIVKYLMDKLKTR